MTNLRGLVDAVIGVVPVRSVCDVGRLPAVADAFVTVGAVVRRTTIAELSSTSVADLVVCIDGIPGLDVEAAGSDVRALAAAAPAVLFAAPVAVPSHEGPTRWPAWWDDLFGRHGLVPTDVVRPAVWDDEAVPAVVREGGVLYVPAEVAALAPRAPAVRSSLHPVTLVRALDRLALAETTAARQSAVVDDVVVRLRRANVQAGDVAASSWKTEPRLEAETAEQSIAFVDEALGARRAVEDAAIRDAAAAVGRQQLDMPDVRADIIAASRRPAAALVRWATSVAHQRRSQLPLFDEAWYIRQYPDVLGGRLAPAQHYRRYGFAAGFSPHPLFDPRWYRSQVGDGLGADDDPLAHYVDAGAAAGLDPHPVFSTTWYVQTQRPPSSMNPLVQYVERGWREERSPHPLFDAPWYLRANRSVAAAGVEPLQHFLERGWLEGRDPRPSFDVRWYLFHSTDVSVSGQNPLVHYVVHGWREGRDPHRLFELRWYLRRHPDVAEAGVEPLGFYLAHGAARGDDPSPVFSTRWYAARHPDVAESGRNALEHYLEHGVAAVEPPSPWAEALLAGQSVLAEAGPVEEPTQLAAQWWMA